TAPYPLSLHDALPIFMKRGRRDEAGVSLGRVRAAEAVEGELREIAHDIARDQPARWRDLAALDLRPALLVGVGLAVFQQITGIRWEEHTSELQSRSDL